MKTKGQSTIEFTFAMIMILLLIYGMVRIFRWIGLDLAERRVASDKALTTGTTPEEQLTNDLYRSKRLNAVYVGKLMK